MKTRLHLLAYAAFLALTSAYAQPAAEPIDHRSELRALAATYETAINSGDLAPLAPLFDANTTGVTVDNQTFHTFDELKAIYDRFHAEFPGVVYRVKLSTVPSLIEGNLAVAHGTADEFVKTSAGEFTYTSTWTVVLRRTDTGWKLVRSQMTMDPFNNSIVRLLQKKAVLTYGLGGIVLGLALGIFLGLAFRRHRGTV